MTEVNQKWDVYNFEEDGVAMSMYNIDSSIYGFARSCMNRALQKVATLPFNKNTILKAYDGRFKDIFHEVYEMNLNQNLKIGISYEHRLIDDMVVCDEMGRWLCLGM